MKRFRILLATFVVFGASSIVAYSVKADDNDQQRSDRVTRMMNLDKDDDGKISKDEMPERLSGMFAKADEDKDGFLTRDEIQKVAFGRMGAGEDGQRGRGRGDRPERAESRGDRGPEFGDREGMRGRGPRDGEGRPEGRGAEDGRRSGGDRETDRRRNVAPASRLMSAIDTDGDGKLSSDEISNAAKALMALDKNDDGFLDSEELQPSRRGQDGIGERGAGERGERGMEARGIRDGDRGPQGRENGRRGRGPGDRGPGDRGSEQRGSGDRRPDGRGPVGQFNPESFAQMMMQRMDKNKDGQLIGDEIPERIAGRMEQLDKNSDSAIDRSELKALAEAMSKSRGFGQRTGRGDRPGNGRPESDQPGGAKPKRPVSDDDIT